MMCVYHHEFRLLRGKQNTYHNVTRNAWVASQFTDRPKLLLRPINLDPRKRELAQKMAIQQASKQDV